MKNYLKRDELDRAFLLEQETTEYVSVTCQVNEVRSPCTHVFICVSRLIPDEGSKVSEWIPTPQLLPFWALTGIAFTAKMPRDITTYDQLRKRPFALKDFEYSTDITEEDLDELGERLRLFRYTNEVVDRDIELNLRDNTRRIVQATIVGGIFAIHRSWLDSDRYSITHLPTHCAAGFQSYPDIPTAIAVAQKLLEIDCDWNNIKPLNLSEEADALFAKRVDEIMKLWGK